MLNNSPCLGIESFTLLETHHTIPVLIVILYSVGGALLQAYVFELDDEYAESDIPTTLIRSKTDCPNLEVCVCVCVHAYLCVCAYLYVCVCVHICVCARTSKCVCGGGGAEPSAIPLAEIKDLSHIC